MSNFILSFLFVSSLVYLHDVIVILFFLVVINAPGILCHLIVALRCRARAGLGPASRVNLIAEQFISFCLDLKFHHYVFL